MRAQAMRARPRRRRLPPDKGERMTSAISPNLLDRQFTATAANHKWIADFTYIWTAEGWLYVAAVVDLFSRRVVGWSMSATMTAQFVADALMMAVWRRGKPDAVMHHSDRGSPEIPCRNGGPARRDERAADHGGPAPVRRAPSPPARSLTRRTSIFNSASRRARTERLPASIRRATCAW